MYTLCSKLQVQSMKQIGPYALFLLLSSRFGLLFVGENPGRVSLPFTLNLDRVRLSSLCIQLEKMTTAARHLRSGLARI